MKIKLFKLLVPALILIASGVLTMSCADKYYYETGADYIDEFYTVRRSDWAWNEYYERFEYFFSNRNIDEYMYEDGVTNGYTWLYEDGVEARKQLEYTYSAEYDDEWFDVTISYDISYDYDTRDGYVGFFVRFPYGNDYTATFLRNIIPSSLDFKVTLLWTNSNY